MRTLRENQRVSYDLQEDRRGKMAAVNLQAAEEATSSESAGGEPEAASDEQAE
jgi:CspA family cold shock protein